jgi:ABC-2 type transport system ATP-binding protein
LLDEPANGLDPEGIAWLRQFLKSYADAGNAVFVSSHLLSEMALMADNVVVIGKGKLMADTSMEQLIAGSSHSSVFVRTSSLAKLERLLKQQKVEFESADGGLRVLGRSTDDIGRFAFEASIPILELTSRNASLEEAFLELTEGSEEYHTQSEKPKKGKRR